jgi:hypothetical protein
MRLIRRALATGRIGRKRSFVAALGMAVAVLPVATALAFFAASGSGTISNVQAGSPSSTVAIAINGALTYAGPSTTNLMPGGTVSFGTSLTCTAGCPAQVTTLNLSSWTSDKVGCDTATFPASFTMPAVNVNASVPATGVSGGTATITWANLAVNQNACAGAKFAFNLVTP